LDKSSIDFSTNPVYHYFFIQAAAAAFTLNHIDPSLILNHFFCIIGKYYSIVIMFRTFELNL